MASRAPGDQWNCQLGSISIWRYPDDSQTLPVMYNSNSGRLPWMLRLVVGYRLWSPLGKRSWQVLGSSTSGKREIN